MFNNSTSHKSRRALFALVLTLATVMIAPAGALAATSTGHLGVTVGSGSRLTAPPPAVVAKVHRSYKITSQVAPRNIGGQASAPFTPPWGALDLVRFAMIALIGVVLLIERAPHRR